MSGGLSKWSAYEQQQQQQPNKLRVIIIGNTVNAV